MKWLFVAVCLVGAFWFFKSPPSNKVTDAQVESPVDDAVEDVRQAPTAVKPAAEPEQAVTTAPQVNDDLKTATRAEAERVSEQSEEFSELPADDRSWVLEEATSAVVRGQIQHARLLQHIKELSSVRQLSVLERTEVWTARGHQ